MEAWQPCTESVITLAAPTQPQEETRPTALATTKALRVRVRQVWRLPWENNWKELAAQFYPRFVQLPGMPKIAYK